MAESRQQEEYFRSLVQDSQDVIMICDGRGVLEYVSPVAERVIGTEEALRSVDDPRSSTLAEVLLVDPTVVTEALRLAKDEGLRCSTSRPTVGSSRPRSPRVPTGSWSPCATSPRG